MPWVAVGKNIEILAAYSFPREIGNTNYSREQISVTVNHGNHGTRVTLTKAGP